MTKVNIMIVEDDAITAMDIENQLKNLGYGVSAKVAYGEDAIQKAKENTPDLVLMDIVLKGEMDGIEAAGEIRTQFDIPVVFLTAYADKDRLERASLTMPFGFILKPFQDRDFKVTIEMALYVAKVDVERKQIGEALRERETRYRRLFENMLNGFAYCQMLYKDGRPDDFIYLNVNKAFGELTGLRDVIGKRVTEVIPGIKEATPEIFDIYARVAETGSPEQFEIDFMPLDIWLNISVYSPQKGYFVAVFDNITERKQVAEALRESEEMFRLFTEQNMMGVIIIQDGLVKYVNKAASEITEYSIGEALDWKPNEFGKLFHPDDLEFVMEQAQKKQEGAKDVVTHYSYRLITKSGEAKWIDQYSKTITFEGKNADLITIINITERKKAEEAQRKSERELRIRNKINSIFLTYPDEEMYAEILKVILKVMESEYGTFGYFDNDGSFVAPAVTRKIYWEKCNVPEKEIIFQKGTFGGIWGKAIKERKTLISNEGPFKVPEGHIPIVNTMVTPIIFRDEVISAIHIANNPDGYDEESRTMLRTIADNIAPVLYARLQRDKLV